MMVWTAWILSFLLSLFILTILCFVVDACITIYSTLDTKELLTLGGFVIVLIVVTIILHHVIFVNL